MLKVTVDLPKEKKMVKKQESSQNDEAASCKTRHGFAKKQREREREKKQALKKLVDSYSSIPRKCDLLEKMIYVYIPSKA